MSLIKADMLYQVHRRLVEIFQSEDLFANKTVILVGDLLQLKPVQGSYIFEIPHDDHFASYYQARQIWKQFQVFELTHNHRQGKWTK